MALGSRTANWILLALAVGAGAAAAQQDPVKSEVAPPAEESAGPKLRFHLEAKMHYRDSEDFRLDTGFVPPVTPVPPTAKLGTVNPGSHFEFSVFSLLADATWSDDLVAHAKIDFIDLHDRNPTSTGRKVDVDEAWLRFGRQAEPATLPARSGAYLKLGKFPKLERQNDRHLESYGLVSTAFNRFTDAGAEIGVDVGRHLYAKFSATEGNPVFFRDPNALAGDHGTPAFREPNPDPQLGSGVVILYDAKIDDLNVSGKLQLGGGVGIRFADEGGQNGVDVLLWGRKRKLAETVEIEGTFYGGDLDLFSVATLPPFLPIHGDDKREAGGNIWLYLGGFSFFGQYVDQKIAGLGRTGLEGEVAWRFDLPLVLAVGGQQLFPYIAPAVRYSELDNDFRAVRSNPAPSLFWDWKKLDAGVRLGILPTIDLTLEYADNRFILGNGSERKENEFLSTLRIRV